MSRDDWIEGEPQHTLLLTMPLATMVVSLMLSPATIRHLGWWGLALEVWIIAACSIPVVAGIIINTNKRG
jgi:hypothetical protein